MPTGYNQRPWSTQYADDYNKKRITWNLQKKKSNQRKLFRPMVPRATQIVPPQYTRAFTEDCYGLDDPMLDDTMLNGERSVQFPNVQHISLDNTYMNDTRDVQFSPVLDPEIEDIQQASPIPSCAMIHVPGEADPVIPESVPIRSETPDLHWICWPEPKKNKAFRRPHTSQGFYTEQNNTGNTPPRNEKPLNAGKAVQYDPKIKSWTNVSSDIDRKAVDAMFNTMRRSQSFYEPSYKPMTSISVNDPPPKDKYTKYGGQVVDPRSLYQQNFFPYYQSHGTGPRDAMHLQELSREMNQSQSPAFNNNYSFNKYPLHMRKNKRSAATDDYVHERSMFMTTTPNCVGHFIIHPDWVSERSSLRRSKSMLQIRGSSKF